MSGYAGGGGGSAAGITIGTSVITGGVDGDILYSNGGVLGGFQLYDDTGAGNGAFALRKTMSGSSATSNFLSVTGTGPATGGAAVLFTNIKITGAGSYTDTQRILAVEYLAGNTGAAYSIAGSFLNRKATASIISAGTWNGALGTGTTNVGSYSFATGATNNVAVYGGLGDLDNGPIDPGTTAAAVFDNRAVAASILIARDNGATAVSTAAWAGTRVQDGGQPQNGLGVLTSATMAVETAAEMRPVISSYTWTNAQVAALPASAGDITVATLPAKTQIRNAYVVITGQAAGPTTVTVSLGDAIAGTPFINYVVASDAKVAANTIYGDAVAERGAAMDVEFYYVPSYTATTLVTAHFISTGGTLSTVTGSTGRVILETVLLP